MFLSIVLVIVESRADMIDIRPKSIFMLCEKRGLISSPYMQFFPSSEIGSISTIEASLLIAFLRISNPKIIFEFGTFLGYTTTIFAMNSSRDSHVYSLDLPSDDNNFENFKVQDILISGRENDTYLSSIQRNLGEVYINLLQEPFREKITLLKVDSNLFDFDDLCAQNQLVDFIFVDGGHDYNTALNDSRKALEAISKNGLVVWHDYGSKLHTDVTGVVDEISHRYHIFRIQGTSLAFYTNDEELEKELKSYA